MSCDCNYIFLWEYGPSYGPDLLETAEHAIRAGAASGQGRFLPLSQQSAYFECTKHGLVLDRSAFKYPPDQVLESANGDPFVPVRGWS